MKPGYTPKKKYPIWLTDAALVAKIKARAKRNGQSVSGFATNILTNHFVAGVATADFAKDIVAPPKPNKALRRIAKKVAVRGTINENEIARTLAIMPEEIITGLGAEPVALCRRCLHRADKHTRGDQHACSLMGCACARLLS